MFLKNYPSFSISLEDNLKVVPLYILPKLDLKPIISVYIVLMQCNGVKW